MQRALSALFLSHPRSVNETYFQHFGVAFGFATTLAAAAFCALVHAVVPSLFEKTASKMILQLANRLAHR